MTKEERIKALADAKKQMKALKAAIKKLTNEVTEQPKLYDKEKFKEELKYLSTLINPKYLVMIDKEIFSSVNLDITNKQSMGYIRCHIGLSANQYSYYERDFVSRKQESPTEFCNRWLKRYSDLDQNQHKYALYEISNGYGINRDKDSVLWFGLTQQQAKYIKKIMEKYENAPTAKINIMKYLLDNFDKIDKRLGINVTEKQIKNNLKASLKAIEKIHNENLENNVYIY